MPGKGKGRECWCRANQSPQSLSQPCFSLHSSSWEEISICARTCRDFAPGMRFPPGLIEGLFYECPNPFLQPLPRPGLPSHLSQDFCCLQLCSGSQDSWWHGCGIHTFPCSLSVSHSEEFREYCGNRDEGTLTLLPAVPTTVKEENPLDTRSVFHWSVPLGLFGGIPQFLSDSFVSVTEGKLAQSFPGWENRWSLLDRVSVEEVYI